jgi:hypothetical protein
MRAFAFARFFVPKAFASSALIALAACAATGTSPLDQPSEFSGKVVGPMDFGQAGEGAGLKAYGLELSSPLSFDDKADCGKQTTRLLPSESAAVADHAGKIVTLRATPYCRVDRSGKYHLKDVTVR